MPVMHRKALGLESRLVTKGMRGPPRYIVPKISLLLRLTKFFFQKLIVVKIVLFGIVPTVNGSLFRCPLGFGVC